jgi:type II secretory pathway predicted ATPase ExeA
VLQYAIERREGFVVITGDIGTGKTTLCRTLLEQADAKPSPRCCSIRFSRRRNCSGRS